jgi:adenylate kinase
VRSSLKLQRKSLHDFIDDQKKRMQAGELLADDEIISIVDLYLYTVPADHMIMDGFPRTIAQAKWLLDQSKTGRFKIEVAIHLDASREAVTQRLLSRARSDDNLAAMTARFDEYEKETKPIMDWLNKEGVKVVNINGERDINTINKEITDILKKS